jgi:hypothetical protein
MEEFIVTIDQEKDIDKIKSTIRSKVIINFIKT